MIQCASGAQNDRFGRHTRTLRIPRGPSNESIAGWSVRQAAIETSGIRKPATPIERMKGTGMKQRRPRPIATASPENTTARPAVVIVRTIASSPSWPAASSSR